MSHAISRQKAKQMIKKFKKQKRDLTEGFIFNVEEVKNLVSNPDAKHFVITFGLNEKEAVSLILCVTDAKYNVLPGYLSAKDGDDGSFLDEGIPFPPFPK